MSRPDIARRPAPDKWATIGHWLDRPQSPSDHPGLAFALVGWAIVVLTSRLERQRQERHTERETNNPFSCRSASACEKPPNDEVRVMFTVGWLVVLFGVLAMRWADGCFPFSVTGGFAPLPLIRKFNGKLICLKIRRN